MKNAVGTTAEGLIRLDAVECEGRTLISLYTLVGDRPIDPVLEAEIEPLPLELKKQMDQIDALLKAGMEETTRQLHRKIYCSDLARKGVDAVWIYQNELGSPVITISMHPSDCANK